VVVSTGGVVASESPLASQAGAVILAQGGNAVDAAVAANAVMCVVAPHSCGIGGDLFAIVHQASTGHYFGLNASGWSPAGMHLEWLQKNNLPQVPGKGIHSVSIPGTVDGWQKLLERFGTLSLKPVLAAAIRTAEEGFPVAERSAQRWDENQHELVGDARATFLPGGRPPKFGEIFRNPELARSLRAIANGGSSVFYEGEIAELLLKLSQDHGGVMERRDLAEYSSEWVDPISTTYRGWTVYELPPNGAGLAALAMLNIVENFPIQEYGINSAKALHVLIEAKKLAYADMLRYICDPRQEAVPLEKILSKAYAAKRAAGISMTSAAEAAEPGQFLHPAGDTVYLSVADRAGNVVSLIQSNYMNFGSGLAAKGAGFVLQNRASLFSADAAHPNVVAGRKRPLHTIIPAFLVNADQRIAFGIQGGWNQSQAHAQFVTNIVDHGMNIQEALEAPRFTKPTFSGFDVHLECRIAAGVTDELKKNGHLIIREESFSETMGGGQAVLHDKSSGVNYGASDPRKDGAAIPEPYLAVE
jgi:gamma-glutamyltranspeptidase / glutathione hydrolase